MLVVCYMLLYEKLGYNFVCVTLYRVKIGDKNDNPPVFNLPHYTTTIEESSMVGKRVKQVYATDRDAGDNGRVEYFLNDDPSGFFVINQYSGWVSVARPMSGVNTFMKFLRVFCIIFVLVWYDLNPFSGSEHFKGLFHALKSITGNRGFCAIIYLFLLFLCTLLMLVKYQI